MDQVLFDFVSAACKLHNWPLSTVTKHHWWRDMGVSDDDFWQPIHDAGITFWANLDSFPWTRELLAYVDNQFRLKDGNCWTICTSPSRCPDSRIGKLASLHSQGIMPPIPVLFSSEKEKYATEDTILIDDNEEVIRRFRAAGGKGIVFPTPYNEHGDYSSDPVAFIKIMVENVS